MFRFARAIVDTIRDPIVLLDLELRLVEGNNSFYSTFHAAPEIVCGHPFLEIQSCQWDIEALSTGLVRIAEDEVEISKLEVRHDFSGLGEKILIINAKRVRADEGGEFIILVVIEDVTDQFDARELLESLNEVLEEKVTQRTSQLESLNQELEAFCYSVSHDLRAPLRALDGFSSELLQSYSSLLDEKGRHYLNRIKANSRRMGELIDDLLRLSRVTRSELKSDQVDLSTMAHEIADSLASMEPLRMVNLSVEPGMQVRGDPTLLRLALTNLISNSWKFTQSVAAPEVVVSIDRSLDPETFFVRDNGAGFDMAHYDKLFAPFQRLHSQREFPGTGIGLAIVQRIITRHEGRIWAHGVEGKGATFYCYLPNKAEN